MTKGLRRYFDGEIKECGDCFERKPLAEFHLINRRPIQEIMKNPQAGDFRSRCKKCRNLNTINRQIEARLEKNPGMYWDCEECDRYNNKRENRCRYCGSMKPRGV